MTRPLDQLGRIVITMELRRTLFIDIGDPVEFLFDNENKAMVIRKHSPSCCIFCGAADDIRVFKGKYVCIECSSDAKEAELAINEITQAYEEVAVVVDSKAREKSEKRQKNTYQ